MQNRTETMARIIDVSHYQGVINWSKVRASGISGMFAKASQGTSMTDDAFARNIAGAKAAGLLVGAYHFLSAASISAAEQEARHFVDVVNSVGGVSALDFPLVMDYENNPAGLGRPGINAIAKAFLGAVEELTGERAIIYTGNAFAQNFDAWAGAYELWIARYSDSAPTNAGPWTAWDFWQYSQEGGVSGIGGAVDLDVFSGTEAELRAKYTKEDDEMNKLLEYADWAWNELDAWVGDAYNDDIISDWNWVQKVRDKTLTYGELLLLKVLIDERRRTKN